MHVELNCVLNTTTAQIVLIGAAGVGKTSAILRYMEPDLRWGAICERTTLGLDFQKKVIEVNCVCVICVSV